MARATEVYIDVDPAGHITVDPYYAQFHLGDTLVWKSANGVAWTIGFHDSRTPTDRQVIQGHGAETDRKYVAKKAGHFPYTVAAIGQRRSKFGGKPIIFLDAACPEIIID